MSLIGWGLRHLQRKHLQRSNAQVEEHNQQLGLTGRYRKKRFLITRAYLYVRNKPFFVYINPVLIYLSRGGAAALLRSRNAVADSYQKVY